jgi:hypothetical protein
MPKHPRAHQPVAEDYLAGANHMVTRRFAVPASAVWAALLDPSAWTEWLPITKVTWTSAQPFGVGTTRKVEIGPQVIEEVFFAWDEGRHMAFRFDRSTLPVSAAVEDFRVVPIGVGCDLRWTGRASAVFPLGFILNRQMARSIKAGLPKLDALINFDPQRFGL